MRLKASPFAILWLLAGIASSTVVANENHGNTLLADTDGDLKKVVISVNSARRSTLRNAELVSNIVNVLPGTTEFLILTNDRAAFSTPNGTWPERISFIDMPAEKPMTMWTQDPFLVLGAPGGQSATTLLASKSFARAGDSEMAERIAGYTGYRLLVSDLDFEGGNIVSDERFILIGANTIHQNAVRLNNSEVEIARLFEQELGRPVLVIGPFPQPIAHLDMMITPLGDGRMLVADSTSGADIAGQALRDDPESVAAFERFCEARFFGSPEITEVHGKDGQSLSAPEVEGKSVEMIARSRTIGPLLDGVAASLERFGYQVERIPLLFGGPESTGRDSSRDTLLATYPMLTYNNVLITQSDVWLPRYGWPAMDQAATERWKDLGFSPHPVEGLTISAMYGGALRCAVKVLER